MDGMGKCEIYNDEMWQDYLLNKLSREELEKAQFHLHQCAFCRERLMRMRSMVRDIQNEGKEEKEYSVCSRCYVIRRLLL